jgi:hypothetical protein
VRRTTGSGSIIGLLSNDLSEMIKRPSSERSWISALHLRLLIAVYRVLLCSGLLGAWLNDKSYRSALLTVYIYLNKMRDAHDSNPIPSQVASGNSNSFYSLVDRTGTNSLDFGKPVITHRTGDGSGYGGRTRRRCYLDYILFPIGADFWSGL